LRPVARGLVPIHERFAATIDEPLLRRVLELVPDEWLETAMGPGNLSDPVGVRSIYVEHLLARMATPSPWLPQDPS
ncbi:MAG: aminotransferase class I and II, partial [Actinomycetota bacterium]|nr:aminotransferase class I and II [Actinomycetota bacterium]